MKCTDEDSDLQYRKDRNDFHRIGTTEKIEYISDLIDSSQDNLTEKKMAQMMKNQFHMDKEANQSTISRLLHSKIIEEVTGKTYSLKMTVKRSKKANTEENKQHRIEVVTQLEHYLKGYTWVSINEVHWSIKPPQKRKWCEVRKKAISNMMTKRLDFSSITAIDNDREEKCVLFVDNAPVHDKKELEEFTAVSKQAILFYAPYIPDLDPLEILFTQWKHDVKSRINDYPGDEAFF